MSKWTPYNPADAFRPDVPGQPRISLTVRFEGVPDGSPLASQLYQQLQGPINRFYLKARQAYALSPDDSLYLHTENPDFAIRYLNRLGVETLYVKVSASVAQQALQKVNHWDWVLIEAYVPDPLDGEIVATAHVRIPQEAVIATDEALPIYGFALDYGDTQPANERYLFAVPTTGVSAPATTSSSLYRSFIVDLRPARGFSALEVDLNVCLSVPYFQPSYVMVGTQLVAYQEVDDFVTPGTWLSVGPPYPPDPAQPTVFVDPATWIGGEQLFPNPGNPTDHYFPLPATQFDETTQTWSFVDQSHGPRGIVKFTGTTFAGGDAYQTTQYVHDAWLIVNNQNGGHIPIASGSRPGEIQLTMGKGDWRRIFTPEGFTTPIEPCYRWKYTQHDDSHRPGHSSIARSFQVVRASSLTNDPATRYGIPYVGTVIIDQINWGVSLSHA